MNTIALMKEEKIENMIYEIIKEEITLDSDLAQFNKYVNRTKTINLSVKRNIDRFHEVFYFQLTNKEYKNLKSQIGTSSLNRYGES